MPGATSPGSSALRARRFSARCIHGAPYVGEEVAHRRGRLGRSYGCPAIRPAIARAPIDEVKDRTLVYAWHPSIDKTKAPAGFAHTGAILCLLDALSHRNS